MNPKTVQELEKELKQAKILADKRRQEEINLRKRELLPIFEKRYSKENLRKLLKERIEFSYFEDGGDYVYLGSNGKRPFGNSNIDSDIAETLGFGEEFKLQEYEFEYVSKMLAIELNTILNSL